MILAFIAGFLLSIAGSFHCLGMCGPIAMAIPISNRSAIGKIFGITFYNSGRMISYIVIGILAGLIGKGISIGGMLQYFSIITGILLLISGITRSNSFLHIPYLSRIFNFNSIISKLLQEKNKSSIFFLGTLNGLLPCGMVIVAAALAMASGSIHESIFTMAGFGLGTFPVMTSIALIHSTVSMNVRQKINKVMPSLICIIGIILIVRGLNLGIPYMSPKFDKEKVVKCH